MPWRDEDDGDCLDASDSQTHEAHLRLEVLLQYAKPRPAHVYVALPHVRKPQSQCISVLQS